MKNKQTETETLTSKENEMRKHTQTERAIAFSDPERYANAIPLINAEIAKEKTKTEHVADGKAFVTPYIWTPTIDGEEVSGRAGVTRHSTREAAAEHAKSILTTYGPKGYKRPCKRTW